MKHDLRKSFILNQRFEHAKQLNDKKNFWTLIMLISLFNSASAQTLTPADELFQQSERRQKVISQRIQPTVDDPSTFNVQPVSTPKVDPDAQCFPVGTLLLGSIDNNALRVADYDLISTLSEHKIIVPSYTDNRFTLISDADNTAPCLSAGKIEQIVAQLQNKLISRGFITTRVLTPEQELNQGLLTLNIAKGTLAEYRVKDSTKNNAHRANLNNAFPSGQGDDLNLRDIEQGLENLRSLPTVSASMEIDAGESKNSSDVVVDWKQRDIPLRLNVSVDDSGSESTGKYLGTVSVAWDNPLSLNDTFNVSYTHSLKPGVELPDFNGGTDKSKTNNIAVNYSVPWGYWKLDMGVSGYYYDQVAAGTSRNYHYTGDSFQGNLGLSRVIYRDSKHKITAKAGLWGKDSKSFIDDAEIDVQHRRTGGWKATLSQRSNLDAGTLTTSLTHKRGTRAFNAIPAPEELFDEGTAKMQIWTADVDWQMPLQLAEESLTLGSHFHGQYSSKLTSQDKFGIGGRYSVQGFSGSLSGEHGWYLRNNLAWHYQPAHEAYLGIDTGRVSGKSTSSLPGKSLTGAVFGLKGRLKQYGDWSYDVFVGTPLHEPEGLGAGETIAGFNLSYSL